MNNIIENKSLSFQNKERNIALDYAKGFAILLVVIYHIYGYTDSYKGSFIFLFCQTVQLPIFFFISGILTAKNPTINVNIYKKATRLLVPFLIFYTIWCIINYKDLYSFILNEFKGGYWFVLVLFEMMAIYAISFKISNHFQMDINIILIGVIFALTIYKFFSPKEFLLNTIFSLNLLWHYMPFFYLGVIYPKICKIFMLKYIIIYIIIFSFTQFYYFKFQIALIIPLCNLFSLLLFTTLFFNNIRPFEKMISTTGKYSLQIYLLHFFPIYLLYSYIPTISNRLIEFVLYLILSFSFVYLIIIVSNIFMRYKWSRLLLFGIK